jgi:head-tail adaptor
MPVCKKIRSQKRQPCIGDMRDQIGIYVRNIITPIGNSTDATELLTLIYSPWAQLETVSGQEFFDEHNILIVPTHVWTMRYLPGIDINHWIFFQSQWYNIIDVNDTEERHISLIIRTCVEGNFEKPVNEA